MNKTILALCVLLAVQGGVYATFFWRADGAAGTAAATGPVFADLEAKAVRSVEVEGKTAEESVALERRGEREWVIASAGDFPADAAKAEAFAKKIAALQRRGVAARSAASHAGLDLSDDASPTRVILRGEGGETLAELLFGKSVAGGAYARLAGEDMVYRVDGAIEWDESRASGFVDTQLLKFGAEQVTRVRYQRGSETTLDLKRVIPPGKTRKEATWSQVAGEPFEAKISAVTPVLEQLSNLVLSDPVSGEARDEHGFGADVTTVIATLVTGEEVSLEVGSTLDDGERYVRVPGKPGVATISKWAAEAILKDRAAFAPDPPPEAPEAPEAPPETGGAPEALPETGEAPASPEALPAAPGEPAAPETKPEKAPEAPPEKAPGAAPEKTPEAPPEKAPGAAPEKTPEAAPEKAPGPPAAGSEE